jgi:hypothetical protein
MTDYLAQNWESLIGSLVAIGCMSAGWYLKFREPPPLSGIVTGMVVAIILTFV